MVSMYIDAILLCERLGGISGLKFRCRSPRGNYQMNHRPLSEIAAEIRADCGAKLHLVLKPYVDVVAALRSIDDTFYATPASRVLAQFLGQRGLWKGVVARHVKIEIAGILAMHDGNFARQRKLD
jgi:hypothetical protein